jgi:cyclopropane fatty-acyl-phospholipid synthase-like methyltransferase
VADCCDPVSYRRLFNSKEAGRRLRRYKEKGLDSLARGMVEYLSTRDIEGAAVLEIGGGLGDLQLELFRAGAATSVNVELSAGYEEAAAELLRAEQLEERVERRLGDFVAERDRIDPADIVVLNRVVCCYPGMREMMDAAVAKTGRFLALSFPRERWFMKTAIAVGNTWWALRSCGFRAYVHPIDGIESVARNAGLEVAHRDRTLGWQAVVFERVA